MNQDEFEDAFADYNDDVFKANLETILIRETRKEKSLLASFCNAILKSWDKKVANKTQIEIKEPGIFFFRSPSILFSFS